MIIKNAKVFHENGFSTETLWIRDGKIVSKTDISGHSDSLEVTEEVIDEVVEEVIDAEGLYAIPGLVDIHFHGAMGKDFCDASEESIRAIAEFEARSGVLAICPATMTYPEEILTKIMKAASSYFSEIEKKPELKAELADLVGINMEGPFLSPGKIGAQNPKYLMAADGQMFERLQKEAGGLIKLVDIAPEEVGSMDFIERYKDQVRISVAHTSADYDTAKLAFEKGAKHMTHLFNGMPGVGHRDPGPIIAGLESDCTVELISDGIHIHPAMVRFTFETFGSDRVILISDSLEATGLSDGEYTLGGQSITVSGKRAVLTDHKDTIAGSCCSLFDCMKTAVIEMGIPLHDAVKAASLNPAKAIGVDDKYGSLEDGRNANVLLMNGKLDIVKIIKDGKCP